MISTAMARMPATAAARCRTRISATGTRTASATCVTPTLSNDCSLNFVDLGELKGLFFTDDANADLAGDGAVNFVDLAIMKSAFFCCRAPADSRTRAKTVHSCAETT